MVNDISFQNMRKHVSKFNNFLQMKIQETLMEEYVPTIIDMIMADYDAELVSRVTDRNSRTNPIFYRDEFREALENFQYFDDVRDTNMKFIVPDIESFDFNQGRLHIIENILEGTIGVYVEVDETQYVQLYDKRPISLSPYDKTVPAKQRIYLLRYTVDVQNRERDRLGKRGSLIRYPFSNTPPIDIFETANTYVEENFSSWMNNIIKNSTKEYAKRGAR